MTVVRGRRLAVVAVAAALVAASGLAPRLASAAAQGPPAARTTLLAAGGSTTPIKHVVVLFQENHSFDNVLGSLCVQDQRCDGSTTGKLLDGTTRR